jgi:hypothetical protein
VVARARLHQEGGRAVTDRDRADAEEPGDRRQLCLPTPPGLEGGDDRRLPFRTEERDELRWEVMQVPLPPGLLISIGCVAVVGE